MALVAVEVSLRLMTGAISFERALAVLIITPEFFLPLRPLAQRYHAGGGPGGRERAFAILDEPVGPGAAARAAGRGGDLPRGPPAGDPLRGRHGPLRRPVGSPADSDPGDPGRCAGGHRRTERSGQVDARELLLRFLEPDAGAILVGGRLARSSTRWLAHTVAGSRRRRTCSTARSRTTSASPGPTPRRRGPRAPSAQARSSSTTFRPASRRPSARAAYRLSGGRAPADGDRPCAPAGRAARHPRRADRAPRRGRSEAIATAIAGLAGSRTVIVVSHRLRLADVVGPRRRPRRRAAWSSRAAGGAAAAGGRSPRWSRRWTRCPTAMTAGMTVRSVACSACSPQRRWIALGALLGFLAIGANVALMAMSAYLVSKAALVTNVAELALAITAVRVLAIGRAAFRYLERYVTHAATCGSWPTSACGSTPRSSHCAPARLADDRSGDLLARIVADVDTLEDFSVRVVAAAGRRRHGHAVRQPPAGRVRPVAGHRPARVPRPDRGRPAAADAAASRACLRRLASLAGPAPRGHRRPGSTGMADLLALDQADSIGHAVLAAGAQVDRLGERLAVVRGLGAGLAAGLTSLCAVVVLEGGDSWSTAGSRRCTSRSSRWWRSPRSKASSR